MTRHVKWVVIAAAILVLPAGMALAQGGPPWEWGGWFWLFPGFRFLFALAVMAAVVFLIARLVRGPARARGNAGLDILNERFARGEIEKAEYEERRRILTGA